MAVDSTLARTRSSYFADSRTPLTSLAFVAPLLVVYEAGVFYLGPKAMHNGVAVWLREFLNLLGFTQYLLLPVLVCSLLLAWHHLGHYPWRVSPRVLSFMTFESLTYAIVLWIVARLQGLIFGELDLQIPCAIEGRELVAYCGAGIYEELLFRLMLLPTVAGLIHLTGAKQRPSYIAAVILTSLVFSLAHYRLISSTGDEFQWFSFCFRTLAGVYFSLLFLYRGFGIAAGAHSIYDVLIAIAASYHAGGP